MTELFLVYSSNSFQSGEAESKCKFLEKGWDIVFKYKFRLLEQFSGLFNKSFHIFVSIPEILFCLQCSSSGSNNSVRI